MVENKFLYVNGERELFYFFSFFSIAGLFAGNYLFILPNYTIIAYWLYFIITTFYLSLSYLIGFLSSPFNTREWIVRTFSHENVDVFLPVCGEPLEVLRNAWDHTSKIRGFNKFFVLDDGKSDEVKALAKQYGFYYIRRESNNLKKAGNLRNAFAMTSSPYILILDADFAPDKDIVSSLMIGMRDPEVAIVQSPQFFKINSSQSWLANAAASVQELFYRLIQVNRDKFNGAICVGTNALYRRSALEPFGGTAPIGYSEDVHTGFQLISKGWKIKYVPIILAKGLCPDTVKQYFTQQYRWAMGSISLFFSKKFWLSDITMSQRACYLTGMFYYISTGLSLVFGALPGIYMLLYLPEKMLHFNLIFSVPSFLFSTVFMYHWMKLPMNADVLIARHISYFSHLLALKDYLMGTLEEWKPTGIKSSSQRYETFKKLYFLHIGLTSILPLGLIIYRVNEGYGVSNFILYVCFIFINLFIQLKRVPYLSESRN